MPDCFKSLPASAMVILPSAMGGIYLMNNYVPVQYVYPLVCIVLLLVVLDFVTVVLIEEYRSRLGVLTIPALVMAMAVIFSFTIVDSLSRFFDRLDYTVITPFIAATMCLIYAAIFMEKKLLLKSYLSINGLALALLWAMGASNQITMPF